RSVRQPASHLTFVGGSLDRSKCSGGFVNARRGSFGRGHKDAPTIKTKTCRCVSVWCRSALADGCTNSRCGSSNFPVDRTQVDEGRLGEKGRCRTAGVRRE